MFGSAAAQMLRYEVGPRRENEVSAHQSNAGDKSEPLLSHSTFPEVKQALGQV